MSDALASSQERQLASPDPSALLAAYEQAQQRLTRLEEENAALRQEIHWIDTLLAVPASVLSPSQKVTLRAATKALQSGSPNDNGLIQIESWKLCKTVGQSKDTFLENLTYLSENVGALLRQTHRVVTRDGNYTTNLYIGSTDLLGSPEQFQAKQRRNHGGERLRCPHCQSDRLRKKVKIICMCCGAVVDEKSCDLNPVKPTLSGAAVLMKQHDASTDPSCQPDQQWEEQEASILPSEIVSAMPDNLDRPMQEALRVVEDPSLTVLFPPESPAQETDGAGSDALCDASGASIGPYPPPARASYCCRSWKWIWNEQEERYGCGKCWGKR